MKSCNFVVSNNKLKITMREDKQHCLLCVSISLTVLFGFIMIWAVIIAIPSIIANTESCNIVNVTYPLENNTNPDNFVNCNCGRGCSASWGYCVKIQVEVDEIKYLAINDISGSSSHYKSECTYSERKCLENKNQSLERAKNISIPFIQKMNKTQACYEYDGDIYLSNSDKNKNITLMCVMIGITTISLILSLFIR